MRSPFVRRRRVPAAERGNRWSVRTMTRRRLLVVPVVALVLTAGCSRDDAPRADAGTTTATTTESTMVATVPVALQQAWADLRQNVDGTAQAVEATVLPAATRLRWLRVRAQVADVDDRLQSRSIEAGQVARDQWATLRAELRELTDGLSKPDSSVPALPATLQQQAGQVVAAV